mgnify:CR=1 FL=1
MIDEKKKIFKYVFDIPCSLPIIAFIPNKGEIYVLSVKKQYNKLVIYGLVDGDFKEDAAKPVTDVLFLGTGNPPEQLVNCRYIDTIMVHNSWVVHVFVKDD